MRPVLLVSLLLCSPTLSAADVVVNFKANLLAMTCTIRIVATGALTEIQTVDFGVLTRAELEAQGTNTRKPFSLQYSNCWQTSYITDIPPAPTWIKTTFRASATWSGYPTEMKGGDNGVAAVLYRTNYPNNLFSLNGATVDWSPVELRNKSLDLTLSLRPTSAQTTAKSGVFDGSLTFTTTYQ